MRIQSTIAVVAALAGVATSACSPETVGPPPAPPVGSFITNSPHDAGSNAPTAKERSVAETYVAALASPAFSALGPALDDEARLSFPGLDDVHGRSGVVHVHEILLGAFEPRTVTSQRVLRTDSEQTVQWTLTGAQARDWYGVPATGKPVTIHGVSLLWTKDDGAITDVHIYLDVAAVKAQLGVGAKELVKEFGGAPQKDATAAAPSATDAGGEAAPQVFEREGAAKEKDNLTTARAALDALERGDLAAYQGAMADDVEIVTLERREPLRGKADTGAYFKAIRRAVGQLDVTITDGWGVGDFAVIEYTIAGEQLAAIGAIPAQHDKAIRLHIVDICEVQANKIARIWRYDNPTEIIASPPT